MALDESTTGDEVFEDRGVKFLVEKTLYEKVKPIEVDFIDTPRGGGFKLNSSLSQESACGSSCSC
ncbi:MAG: iron-sulfur cluster assembly accessory protein [Syntrophus sp. (in: bacteria)]|nr:iron-sulfur cluster assembly accessory protein [Syntrophus sp. (in: bacteria)]